MGGLGVEATVVTRIELLFCYKSHRHQFIYAPTTKRINVYDCLLSCYGVICNNSELVVTLRF